jgi:hypothetical protein
MEITWRKDLDKALHDARARTKNHAEDLKRFGQRNNAQWNPTLLVIDPQGMERGMASAWA